MNTYGTLSVHMTLRLPKGMARYGEGKVVLAFREHGITFEEATAKAEAIKAENPDVTLWAYWQPERVDIDLHSAPKYTAVAVKVK